MNRKKTQIVLVAVIILFGAYLLMHRGNRIHYTLPVLKSIAQKDVTRLVLVNKGETITLERQGTGWTIAPQGYPADAVAVGDLLAKTDSLQLTALAAERGGEARYDLDPGNRIEVSAFHNNTLLRTIMIGKTAASGQHTFVELGSASGIYHAAGNLQYIFDKTTDALRDKTVMRIDDVVTALRIDRRGKTLLIKKATQQRKPAKGSSLPTQAPAWVLAGGKAADSAVVETMIRTASHLICDGFLDGKTKKDFHAPIYTLTLQAAAPHRLTFFKEQDHAYPVLSSDSPYPFRLDEWKAKELMQNLAALRASKR